MKNKKFFLKGTALVVFVLGLLTSSVFGAISSDPNAGLTSGNASALTGTSLTETPSTSSTGSTTFNCSSQKPKNIGELFEYAICILGNVVVPFLISLALVMFIAGIVKYVANGDNEEKREAGRGLMLFGIIALFVMVSVWGLVKILYNSIFDGEFTTTALPKRATEPFK